VPVGHAILHRLFIPRPHQAYSPTPPNRALKIDKVFIGTISPTTPIRKPIDPEPFFGFGPQPWFQGAGSEGGDHRRQ